MKGGSSHNKRIQTESIPSQSTSTQIEENLKDTRSSSDPTLWRLQEELAQAHLALKKYRNETVHLQNYQELQKKFRQLTVTEDETFSRFRQVQEILKKVKIKVDKVMDQIDTISSLYSDVLSCRLPTTNYAMFLLQRYLLLKIKAIKADKPI